jgi:hypothetical protein
MRFILSLLTLTLIVAASCEGGKCEGSISSLVLSAQDDSKDGFWPPDAIPHPHPHPEPLPDPRKPGEPNAGY